MCSQTRNILVSYSTKLLENSLVSFFTFGKEAKCILRELNDIFSALKERLARFQSDFT